MTIRSPATAKSIVMLGTDLRAPGGMTAVARSYVAGGLFDRWQITYVSTYFQPTTWCRLQTAARALLHFLWLVLTRRVSAVHAHVAARGSFWRKSIFLLIGSSVRIPTIFHLHDGSFPAWFHSRSRSAQALVRFILRRMDLVCVLTDNWQVVLRTIEPTANYVVLENPVALPQETSRRVQGEILFLARLWPEKGIYDLLTAISQLVPRYPHLKLICAGDGDSIRVMRKASELGIADHLTLPGWVEGEEKNKLLRTASVFVLPSYFEGLPIGILEAMAHGIPVVATSVGGIPEALGTSAGLLFEPGDVSSLATCLEALLSDSDRLAAMGNAGRTRAQQKFAVETVLDKLDGIYSQLGLRQPVESSR